MRLLAILALLVGAPASAATPVPAPAVDPAARGVQTAVLAGGCFWGMEAVFEHVNGVRSVVSGYAGATGPAEAIRISYDPSQVSYGDLLRIYFAVAHDPTQLNRQGPDVGLSYRSAIFPQNDAQRQVANGELPCSTWWGEAVQQADRHTDRNRRLLACWELPSGFHAQKPASSVHFGSRRAETGSAEARVPHQLPELTRQPRAGPSANRARIQGLASAQASMRACASGDAGTCAATRGSAIMWSRQT